MILVTGATGHIGNVLVRELVRRGEKVRVFVLPGEKVSCFDCDSLEIYRGNILDYASLVEAMRGVKIIFHLAGLISIMPGQNPMVWKVNVEGTRNVIRAIGEAGAGRLVYTSSIHALGRPPHGVTIDETIPFDTGNHAGEYDRSKAAASLLVLEAARAGLDCVIACPTGVIGPYDFGMSELGGLIYNWMHDRLHFLVDGAYDFVDVRDIAQGLILAAEKGISGETYILSGERLRIIDLHKLVEGATGKKSAIFNTPWWMAKLGAVLAPVVARLSRSKPVFTMYSLSTVRSNSVIASTKAARALGYAPRALKDTIGDTVRWWGEYRPRRDSS